MTKLQLIHDILCILPIPMPVSWQKVMSSPPEAIHCSWGIVLALGWTIFRFFVYVIGKRVGIYLMGLKDILNAPHDSNYNGNSNNNNNNKQSQKDKDIIMAKQKIKKLMFKFGKNIDKKMLEKQTELSSEEINSIIYDLQKKEQAIKEVSKWNETLFLVVCYSSVLILGCIVLLDKEWLYSRDLFYRGWPNQYHDPDVKLYYLCQLGLYIHLAIAHLIVDRHLSDFWVMFVHHFSTILLISVSYSTSYLRIGACILLLHDVSDPFLNGAKISRYAKNDFFCNLSFTILLISWFVTRLVIYPYHCIQSIHYELLNHIPSSSFHVVRTCETFLILLYVFHWYWFSLIFKIAYRTVKGSKVEDVRSDDEKSS